MRWAKEDGSTVAWGWFGLGYGDLQPHLTAVKCLQATAGAFAAVRQDGRAPLSRFDLLDSLASGRWYMLSPCS